MRTLLRSLAVGLVLWPSLAGCSDDVAPAASASGSPSAEATASAAPDPALDTYHEQANAICLRDTNEGAALVADNAGITGEEIAAFVAGSELIADRSISAFQSLPPPPAHAEVVQREFVGPITAQLGTQKELTRVAGEKGAEHPEAKALVEALRDLRGQVNKYSRKNGLTACIDNAS